jgi:hypothetical protein
MKFRVFCEILPCSQIEDSELHTRRLENLKSHVSGHAYKFENLKRTVGNLSCYCIQVVETSLQSQASINNDVSLFKNVEHFNYQVKILKHQLQILKCIYYIDVV